MDITSGSSASASSAGTGVGRTQPQQLLPSFMQPQPQRQHQHQHQQDDAQQERAKLLPRSSQPARQQQQRQQQQQQQQQPLASNRAALAVYAALAVLVVVFAAAGGAGRRGAPPQSRSGSGGRQALVSAGGVGAAGSTAATPARPQAACAYGALPGTWVSSAPAGGRWQVLHPACQLTNWLAHYEAAAAAAAGGGGSNSSGSSGEAGAGPAAGAALPAVHMLLLSDSVDRYIVQHVCDHLKGRKHTVHMDAAGAATAAAAAAVAATASHAAAFGSDASAAPAAAAAPSDLIATAYAFHTCEFGHTVPLKLASSYFPGVHPTGPFHRGLRQPYTVRIAAAVEMWAQYAAGAGTRADVSAQGWRQQLLQPHAVSVASALWDVARLWGHERGQVAAVEREAAGGGAAVPRGELSRALLDGWVANFSQVVRYSQAVLPQARVWLTHTTMLPAHDLGSGLMRKSYLGRRYFIEQLNAAAAAAADELGLQLVDYAALSGRFREHQRYLADLIHPNAEVSLEVFNVLLNIVIAAGNTQQGGQQQEADVG